MGIRCPHRGKGGVIPLDGAGRERRAGTSRRRRPVRRRRARRGPPDPGRRRSTGGPRGPRTGPPHCPR
ncbi:hypothetical protein BRC63_01200 [Halobacteriales archaeon QH_10_70_21]|nr:MAG: hypothetical protein BRC63_01200 [Halobacteriales archaeon QH_10_70_21]